MASYASIELGAILGISKQAVLKRAAKEGWPCELIKNSAGGGHCKRFALEGLPDDVRLAVMVHNSRQQEAVIGRCSDRPNEHALIPASRTHLTIRNESSLSKSLASQGMNDEQKAKALGRADLVKCYVKAMKKAKHGLKSSAREQFETAYNSGFTYPELFRTVGTIDWKTLERWKVLLKNSKDPLVLADQRGTHLKGKGLISSEQEKILVPLICNPNGLCITEIIRQAKAIMADREIENGFSEDTYRRYIQQWRSVNLDHYTFWRDGEHGMDEVVLPYLKRDWSKLQVGDVLVADGHILNGEAIHPETGKPKRMTAIFWFDMRSNYPVGWEIMPTENTLAIASALRRAILRLGKVPRVLYLDNGRAFRAKYFQGCADFAQSGLTGLFERLGSRCVFAWPYHGQSKPVERFFGTFAGLERLSPSYTGTSIDTKPPHLRRGEKLHARIHEKLTGGRVPTIEEWHRAIAAWVDKDYGMRPQKRTHLKGRCPIDVFMEGCGPGVDGAELTLLMMHEKITRVGRNGVRIRIDGEPADFYDQELYGRSHSVLVRYDRVGLALGDTNSVLVYSEDGRDFICEARRWEAVHPMAEIFGDDEEKRKVREAIALKRRLKKQTIGEARDFAESDLVQAAKERCEMAGFDGKPVKLLSEPPSEPEISEEECRRMLEGVRELERIRGEIRCDDEEPKIAVDFEPLPDPYAVSLWDEIDGLPEMDRYERLMELEVSGHLIPKRFQSFMRYLESTERFERTRDYWESRRQLYASMTKAKEGIDDGGA